MGSGDRGAIAEAHPESVFTINGIVEGTMLVDGFVAATWCAERRRDLTTLVTDPVAPIATSDRVALKEKGVSVLAISAPNDRHALVDAFVRP